MQLRNCYTIEQTLEGIRQGTDLLRDDPIQAPLYMVVDVCANLDVRYPHRVLKYLPPGSIGVIQVPTLPYARRRGKVSGNGVTRGAVEIVVARANRRPAYMRSGIPQDIIRNGWVAQER